MKLNGHVNSTLQVQCQYPSVLAFNTGGKKQKRLSFREKKNLVNDLVENVGEECFGDLAEDAGDECSGDLLGRKTGLRYIHILLN